MRFLKTCLFLIPFLFLSCGENKDPLKIVDKVIENYGGKIYKNAEIKFDFRGREYTLYRSSGKYDFYRVYADTLGNDIREGLNNSGGYKILNGDTLNLTDDEAGRIAYSVNAVMYFTNLPLQLNDPAVVKKFLRSESVNGVPYNLIEVTFKQAGGGEDFDDRYVYWFREDKYTMDYFAYYFKTNGGGSRFRVVENSRIVEGIVFTDHINYKAETELGKSEIEKYGKLFESGKVEKVSEIKLENIKVEIL